MHDKESVLQATIDAPQLSQYFHGEKISSRVPLRIVKGQWYDRDIGLKKFDMPVVFVSSKSESGPFLEVISLKIQSETAEIEFRYIIEGIIGNAVLKKTNGHWVVESMSIRER